MLLNYLDLLCHAKGRTKYISMLCCCCFVWFVLDILDKIKFSFVLSFISQEAQGRFCGKVVKA